MVQVVRRSRELEVKLTLLLLKLENRYNQQQQKCSSVQRINGRIISEVELISVLTDYKFGLSERIPN